MSYSYKRRTIPFKYHKEQITHQLMEAGVTAYGLLKSESRYLPYVINENEHVKAAIYGQHHSNSAMLVATNERLVYLDKKPMSETVDEITYDVVSGVKVDVNIFFSTVILHTAVANYDLHYVNTQCAEKFAQYIEKQRMRVLDEASMKAQVSSKRIEKFLPGYFEWVAEEEAKSMHA
jgi:hypothetical protein